MHILKTARQLQDPKSPFKPTENALHLMGIENKAWRGMRNQAYESEVEGHVEDVFSDALEAFAPSHSRSMAVVLPRALHDGPVMISYENNLI